MTRRARIVIPAAAAVVAVAVAAAAIALDRDPAPPDRADGGPLAAESVAAESTLRLHAGRAATFAGIEVWNDGPLPVVLERIVPVDPDPGIETVGHLAAPSPERGLIAGYDTYPPAPRPAMRGGSDLPEFLPLEGYAIPPGAGRTQLHVGVRSTSEAGLVRIPAFAVEYRVGGDLYRLTIPVAVAICTPPTAWDGLDCTSTGP